MTVDSLWSSTSVLLPFDDSLLDARGGNNVSCFGGVALSSSVGTPFGAGNALYLDGSDDYLSIPSSAKLTPNDSDLTIEAWIYRTIDMGAGTYQVINSWSGSAGYQLAVVNNNVYFGAIGFFGTSVTGGATSLNTWHYVTAKSYGGTVGSLSVQIGTSVTSGTRWGLIGCPSAVHIGRASNSAAQYFQGYISQLRYTVGNRTTSSVPTAAFPVPTVKGTVYNASDSPVAKSVLFYDRSSHEFLGGANSDPTTGAYIFHPKDFGEVLAIRVDDLFDIMTDECVFDFDPLIGIPGKPLAFARRNLPLTYSSALVISENGEYIELTPSLYGTITATSDTFFLGLHDFTIELHFYVAANAGTCHLIEIGTPGTSGSLVVKFYAGTTKIEVYFYDTDYRAFGAESVGTISLSEQHQLQVRRINGVFDVAVDGNSGSWCSTSSTNYNITATSITLGGGSLNYGRIGKVRVSKGPRRAAKTLQSGTFLKGPSDGGSADNCVIIDRVTPGG